MRLHGQSAAARRTWVESEVVKAMWAARVTRVARAGARTVLGLDGERYRVKSVRGRNVMLEAW